MNKGPSIDEGVSLETFISFWTLERWQSYVINSADNTQLSSPESMK